MPISDSEPPGRGGPPVEDRSSAGWRKLLRRWRVRRNGAHTGGDGLLPPPAGDGADPLAPHERVLIGNILKVRGRTAADVMVPRVDIVALDVETPFPDVVKFVVEQGHSRVPVYSETLDNVTGFIHVKDVLPAVAERRSTKLSQILRKVLFVAPSVPVFELLVQMRQTRSYIAMVVDEFGGIDGLVTIEDLVEEIVGEIEDEFDVAQVPVLVERSDGSLIADARAPIELLEEREGTRLRDSEQEEIDTLGGLVATIAGRVPKRGEVIAHPAGLEFEVLDADPRRIKRLRVRHPGAGDTRAA
jgi:magnesium and cobalt transporter